MGEMRIVLGKEKKCQEMALAIEAFDDNSYKNNLKIMRLPVLQKKKLPRRQPICAYVFSLILGLKISQY